MTGGRWTQDALTYGARLLVHWMPWRVLDWLDKRLNICWTSIVMVKLHGNNLYGESWPLRVNSQCWDGPCSPEKGDQRYDYCGKYKTYVEHQAALARWTGRVG